MRRTVSSPKKKRTTGITLYAESGPSSADDEESKSRGAPSRVPSEIVSEGTQTPHRLDRARRKKHETDINQYSCEKLQIARNCAA